MNKSRAKRLAERKRRIAWRLWERSWSDQARPMFKTRHIRYERTDRMSGSTGRADRPDELTDRTS